MSFEFYVSKSELVFYVLCREINTGATYSRDEEGLWIFSHFWYINKTTSMDDCDEVALHSLDNDTKQCLLEVDPF